MGGDKYKILRLIIQGKIESRRHGTINNMYAKYQGMYRVNNS